MVMDSCSRYLLLCREPLGKKEKGLHRGTGTVGNSSSITAVTTPDEGGNTENSETNQCLAGDLGSVPRKIHEKIMRTLGNCSRGTPWRGY